MINEQIRDREVRVIGTDGQQLGVMSSRDAQKLADEAELDLIKISPKLSHRFVRLWTMASSDMNSRSVKRKQRRNNILSK